MPTIRIDDNVWEWLKTKARPFEDTPNSVLRRIVGLDPPLSIDQEQEARWKPVRAPGDRWSRGTSHRWRDTTGATLNRKFGLGVRQALYHKDGKWFHILSRFPGALCDRLGFVRFETETQFRDDPLLDIGEHTNVRTGIASHPRFHAFALEVSTARGRNE